MALKRNGERRLAASTRRALLAALRRIAADGVRTELSATLKEGRTVYQDAGEGRVERIAPDGTRNVGRFINRRFVPDERQ